MLGSCYHYFYGIYLQYLTINVATVHFFFSYKSLLWYHYYDGITPLNAKYIATVQPLQVYIFESWFHSSDGINPLLAYNIATVFPYLFYNSGLCIHYFGISYF